ncbi:SAP domain-containing ribonucleoprotein isoform X1 [Oncorhynchus mykiss]|uniref:SAP domain-containing ribonucleoprotein isoform X1 n=2 Tax=Oncorhynchus mykiss TaxID=8022 RepID=UPI001877DD7A|nr:SAP domain-containing ribonucleoprotein isoform X1 [Oncorhynchus mykiss]
MAEVVELQKLKLAELKHECETRGLDVKGNKVELITRLQAYLEEHEDDMGLNEDDVLGEEPEDLTKEDAITEDNDKKPIVSEETAEKKVVKITPPASVDERVQKRAERFNVPASADGKKAIRAARFGLPAAAPPTSTPVFLSIKGVTVNKSIAVSVEQLKKRAERFGGNVSSVSKKVEEDEKLKKRKERFGILAAVTPDVEAKKRKRSERFGNVTV